MNKGLLIGFVLILVVATGGYFIYTNSQQAPSQEGQQAVNEISGASIEIADFEYSPSTIKVKPGEKITVINRDIASHSVTSDEGGLFDSGVIGKDKSVSIAAPIQPGTYPFHCTPHPSMTGEIVVEE